MSEKAIPYSNSQFNMALVIRLKKHHMNKHGRGCSRLLPLFLSLKCDSGELLHQAGQATLQTSRLI